MVQEKSTFISQFPLNGKVHLGEYHYKKKNYSLGI
jgi:hypothetical protein